MSRFLADSAISVLSKVLVSVLVVIIAIGTVSEFLAGGVATLPANLLYLAVALVVAVAVFTDSLDSPTVQTVLGVGLVAYGATLFSASPIVAALLIATGALAVGIQLSRRVR